MINLKKTLEKILKQEESFLDLETGEINYNKVKDSADKIDKKLITLLAENKETKEKFFTKIKDIYVFNINDFKFFLDENKINNSYTQYANKIGLSDNVDFLNDRTDVVLNFPFKDCVLEGGQSTEEGTDVYFEYSDKNKKYEEKEAKRNEIFFNQILAHDEIDRLFDKKALVNWKRFTKENGKDSEIVKEIKRDKDGLIKENLIIKGNNLLALHSLKSEFTNKVKLIYIDPPYNTGSDGFQYNDNFNHSTWLTFMRNRLIVSSELLNEKGAIFVHIDHHELGYLNVLMDEIFKKENKVQIIAVKTSSPAGFKTVNPGPIDVTEYILFYTKDKKSFPFKKMFVSSEYDNNYNLWIDNIEDDPTNWRLKPLTDKVYEEVGIATGGTSQIGNKNAKEKWGEYWKIIRDQIVTEFALKNADRVVSVRDPHKPSQKIVELIEKSKQDMDKIFVYTKDKVNKTKGNDFGYIYSGGALSFYSNKVKDIDGSKTPTVLLTDFWSDISWDGIAKEGGIKLKNGKKPEKLIRRIIEMCTNSKNDIVLDYHLGSGTTCAVAHKMGQQYIGIEQLDYRENDSVVRLKNVIDGDESGISKSVNWKGGGDFIYFELAKWNEQAKEEINEANDLNALEKMFDNLYKKYFLNYNVKIKEFKEKIIKEENFKKLTLDEQKKMFLMMLDLNQMYVQESEIADKQFSISKEDQKLTKDFYQNK